MPRVDFYRVHGRTKAVVCYACDLCQSAVNDQFRVLLRVRPEQLEQLDQLLWTRHETDFISHERTSGGTWPVGMAALLTTGPIIGGGERALLINTDSSAPLSENFGHVAEIFSTDPTAQEPVRNRYRTYQQNGWRIGYTDIEKPTQ